MEKILYVGVLIAFFAVLIFIGYKSRKKANSVNNYVLGGRSVGPWLTAFSYGTAYFSAVIFIGYAGRFGWEYGTAATWIGIGNAIFGAMLAWAVLGRRTRQATQSLDSATMPDYFSKRFGDKKLKTVASIIIFVFLIPYTASLYKGLGGLFNMAFGIDYYICVLIIAVVTAAYVLLGGYIASAWSDFIQGLIMLVGIVAVITAVILSKGGLEQAITEMSQFPVDGSSQQGAYTSFFGTNLYGLIMVIILTSFGTWGLPQMTQKFYAIKNEGMIKKGMVISTIFAFVVAGGCYFLGSFGRLFYAPEGEKVNFDAIVPTMLKDLNPILIALVILLVFAASMSTLASLVMTSSSSITLDLIKPNKKKEMTQKGQLLSIRAFIAIFIALSALIAILNDTFNIAFIAELMGVSWGALAGAFLAPYLFSLYWKRTTKAACWTCFAFGVTMGLLAFVFRLIGASLPEAFTESWIYTYFLCSPIYVGAWSMMISCIILPVVSAFTKAPDKAFTDKLFECYNK